MFKNLFQVYTLLVCFVTLLMGIFQVTTLINPALSLIKPNLFDSHYEKYKDNQSFKLQLQQHEKDSWNALSSLDEKGLTAAREKLYADDLARKRIEHRGACIDKILTLIVIFVVFSIHWRMFRKSNQC